MSKMAVSVDSTAAAYRAGDDVTGQVSWDLPGLPERVEVRLAWVARARGGGVERGVGVSVTVEGARSRDQRSFSLPAPGGPQSYHGRTFDLQWQVELLADPGGLVAEAPIVIGPCATVTTCPPQPLE